MKFLLVVTLLFTGSALAAADPALLRARDAQDRAALEALTASARDSAAKLPKDAGAQYRYALASSYLAEVAQEVKDKGAAKRAAEAGIPAAQAAVSLDSANGEYYRVLGTLYGQAIQDLFSALSYGKKAKEALDSARQKQPNSSEVWVSQAVGSYYMPPSFGGGPDPALQSLRRALELDPKNAEAWLWLGLTQRKKQLNAEARQSFEKSLALDPNRLWARQQLAKTPVK